MFEARDLPEDLRDVRADHAPDALVLDCDRDVETLSAPDLDELATRVDHLEPASYPDEWLPREAPDLLRRVAGPDLVVGLPEHGGVTWSVQTDPPVVLVRPRTSGSPADFVDFRVAEALVTVGAGYPEHFLAFFERRYVDLAALADPTDAYQIAAALYDAYRGLTTRETFRSWADDRERLHRAWRDAGEALEPRLADLVGAVGRGETVVADATEYACSAVKHDLDLPAPFTALDTLAYREHGADFALEWAERVLGDAD